MCILGKTITYAGSTDEVNDAASNIFLISSSLGRDTIKERAEHIASLAHRVHVARDNCLSDQHLNR
jgi:hypothetical protein